MAQPKPASSRAAMAGAAYGDSGSGAALRRLGGHLEQMRSQAVQPLLHKALSALRAGRRADAAAAAAQALTIDNEAGLAWHILAICQEKDGDFTTALASYEQALTRMPDEPEIACDLGRLALKMGMPDSAEALFANYLTRRPGSIEGINNLACAQRDLMKFVEAIETLRAGLADNPQSALLWNALGSVLVLQGQMDQAGVFFDEALRLDANFASAYYNRAAVRLALGNTTGAIEDLDVALAAASLPADIAGMRVARAKALLAAGNLPAGWDAYESRLDPHYQDAIHFAVDDLPRWSSGAQLDGRRLLLIGEQGLGDEVLFANTAPELLSAIGPRGQLALAVEPRLVALFARSFPQALVGPHASFRAGHSAVRAAPFLGDRMRDFDAWAPLGEALRWLRPSAESFDQGPYLKPEPARVDHWRTQLAALPGLKVGVLWKSLLMDADRSRYFAPFAEWLPLLATPGVTLVNLQYGDSAAERAQTPLWTPPGVDLKDDLDEVAALTCALDLVIAPANATSNIAAACGAEVWLISVPGSWPHLGTERYPWYPSMRVFTPQAYARWRPLMAQVAEALAVRAGG